MKSKRRYWIASCIVFASVTATFAEPSLTIYNQGFAVVRDWIELSLTKGENHVTVTNITSKAEPQSVMLRDPTGKHTFRILEQDYRADPVSAELLLSLYEGQEINFITESEMVRGKIIRGGRIAPRRDNARVDPFLFEDEYIEQRGHEELPIIEIKGQLRFGLPGEPLFPSLKDDTILKPTLNWLIETEQAGHLDAELCYITWGMSWEADYNL
ncbi:MAG: hypothetical protein JSU70_06290, partial [Phycisphaerales bacterium]